jgi:hypothetical protein
MILSLVLTATINTAVLTVSIYCFHYLDFAVVLDAECGVP